MQSTVVVRQACQLPSQNHGGLCESQNHSTSCFLAGGSLWLQARGSSSSSAACRDSAAAVAPAAAATPPLLTSVAPCSLAGCCRLRAAWVYERPGVDMLDWGGWAAHATHLQEDVEGAICRPSTTKSSFASAASHMDGCLPCMRSATPPEAVRDDFCGLTTSVLGSTRCFHLVNAACTSWVWVGGWGGVGWAAEAVTGAGKCYSEAGRGGGSARPAFQLGSPCFQLRIRCKPPLRGPPPARPACPATPRPHTFAAAWYRSFSCGVSHSRVR